MSEAAATDVVLIGAGIMSATLGTLLKELEPSLSISILEVLSDCALESSGSWNNAGTGHAANCELNYTPERPDGSVDISKALEVNTEFDLSRQLWAYLVKKDAIANPRIPARMSFVWGDANVAFLKGSLQSHVAAPLLSRYGLLRESRADWRLGAAYHGGTRRGPAGGSHPHRYRHGR
jgi:malate dehydrogenase (quinone)